MPDIKKNTDFSKTIAVIPARYQSSRFPGKPLALIAGKPMIQHVYEKVIQVPSVHQVVVATDHYQIFETVIRFGGQAVMTAAHHKTGTDRIVEVASQQHCHWILNVQGDEPLINPNDLDRLIHAAQSASNIQVATLIFPIRDNHVFQDPNVVKVVLNANNEALYFSRSPIPFERTSYATLWKHLGVYLYQKDFLLQYSQWPQSPLEQTEQLEQLRILDRGTPLLCVEADYEGIGVDCPEDLERADSFFRSSSLEPGG